MAKVVVVMVLNQDSLKIFLMRMVADLNLGIEMILLVIATLILTTLKILLVLAVTPNLGILKIPLIVTVTLNRIIPKILLVVSVVLILITLKNFLTVSLARRNLNKIYPLAGSS